MTVSEFVIEAATVLVSLGVAYGTVKAKLHNKIGFDKHADICKDARAPIYEKIDRNHEKAMDVLMTIKEDIGEIKGQLKQRKM